jgi:hypothetical protein
MDVRPITAERSRPVDGRREPDLLARLHRIARDTFLEFDLGSLVRLDLRSDAAGELYILEANPKPDLKVPAQGVTSLISTGLAEAGMQYDDLILSLIADRLDFLLTHRRGSVGHIVDLLDTGRPKAAGKASPEDIVERSLDALIMTLEGTRDAGRKGFAAVASEVTALRQQVEKLADRTDRAAE